jgi:molecular chaperone HscC
VIVGIDLGTTHSLVGRYETGGPRLFPNALGDLLTPSAISLDQDGHVIVGRAALDRMVSHPGLTVAAFKRWMGTDRETRLGDKVFRAEELSALVLRSLVADAEAATGDKVTEAVISVPAYFSDAQRHATRAAGELAGIRVERLINEPTAAALAYGLTERKDGGRFLVLDLGGGTFDVSVLEVFDGIVEVHASTGDNFLGGEDFLDVLVQACARDLGIELAQRPASDIAQVRRRLEQLKRELGNHGDAVANLSLGGEEREWRIDEARFAQLAEPLVQRLRAPLERAVRDSRIQPDQLDEILLVGGATRMPLVPRLVSRMFGRLPLRHVSPDHAIALGAACAAGLKARDQALEEIILTDVCPYTLGTQISRRDHQGRLHGGFFDPIIHRNSTVPVSRVKSFFPVSDQQERLMMDVYQGESPMVENNVKLGAIEIALRKGKPVHENEVSLRFTYDINGVLQVEATIVGTGERHELLLEQNPGRLSAEDIRVRLQALSDIKVHPRERQENIVLLARAERAYEELLDHRDMLQHWIANFRSVLDSQDDRVIVGHRKDLARALDELEGSV